MGDRANVFIREGNGEAGVYLYTHWGGYELADVVHKTLQDGARLNDHQYLARIIFRNMGAGELGETGYGISASMGDNERPIICIDCENQTISLRRESDPGTFYSQPFAEFVANPGELRAAYRDD